jgi:uncharacterized repeat protein (TIGR01451 family)
MSAARLSISDRGARRPGRRARSFHPARGLLATFVVGLVVVVAGSFAATAQAAPPTVVWSEDFENTGNAAILLNTYQGAAPAQNETYTAAAGWLRDCNGWVLTGTSPTPGNTLNCTNWGELRGLATSLGGLRGLPDPASNHAVTGYTNSCGDPGSPQFGANEVCGGANQIQWQTTGNSIAVVPNRFYTFSVDAAYTSCQAGHPLFDFYIVVGANEIPTSPTQIDGCANGNGAYTFTSPGSVFLTSSSVGLRLRNQQGTSIGNDGAFDNVRLLDVTPTLHKAFSPDDLNATAPSTLTFTIENTDELAAKNGWSFTDNLPTGLEVSDPASASTTCPGGQVTASPGATSIAMSGNLNAGQASCTLSVNVVSPEPGTFENCPTNVTQVGLNPPECSTVVFRAADLEIEKSSSREFLVPDENVTFEMLVTNHGPDTAVGTSVTDELPDHFTFVEASPECAELDGTLTCEVGDLPAGETRTYTVTGMVEPTVGYCMENTASVESAVTIDLNTDNNTSTICPRSSPEVALVKTGPASIAPGGEVKWSLTVTNNGPGTSTGSTVEDAIPAGVTNVTTAAKGCTIADGKVACKLGELAPGESRQITLLGNAPATFSTCFTNAAKVTDDEFDYNTTNNTGAVKSCTPDPVYTLDLDAKVEDTVPSALDAQSATATQGTCSVVKNQITCDLGAIPAGQSVTATVTAQAIGVGNTTNTASVTSSFCKTKPCDSDPADVKIDPTPLKLTKKVNKKKLRAGGQATYRIRVSNPAEASVHDVRVCDSLPSGLVFVSASPKAKLSGGKHCWTISTLGAGKARTFKMTVRALPGASGRKVNRATATSPDAKTQRAKRAIPVVDALVRAGGFTG